MHRLHLVDAGVRYPALPELSQPGIVDAGSLRDLHKGRLAAGSQKVLGLVKKARSAHTRILGKKLPTRQARFCLRASNSIPAVQWAESQVSCTLADNLARFGRERGIVNWNQMADQFADWSKDKPFVEPISVNTLRNIAKRTNAPQASTLMLLANFLEVPVYMLFIEDSPSQPDLIVTLNSLVATFVNGDKNTRAAIQHMLSAFSSARPKLRATP